MGLRIKLLVKVNNEAANEIRKGLQKRVAKPGFNVP
jgi:hypothetical protein